MAISDQVKIIDDVITREVEFADEPTDDIQNAWMDIKKSYIKTRKKRKRRLKMSDVDVLAKVKTWLEEVIEDIEPILEGDEELSDGTEDIHEGFSECAVSLLELIKEWENGDE